MPGFGADRVYARREHAGVIVEIVHDDDCRYADPEEHHNVGTIYSWAAGFDGDERIESEYYHQYPGEDPVAWFAEHFGAALTIPLFCTDRGGWGARIRESESRSNCAIVFTAEEIVNEWPGGGEVSARAYAKARIDELDQWLQGNVWGIVVRERDATCDPGEDGHGEILESVWGFIGDPGGEWIRQEANEIAEGCARMVEAERQEAYAWACRDVVTLPVAR